MGWRHFAVNDPRLVLYRYVLQCFEQGWRIKAQDRGTSIRRSTAISHWREYRSRWSEGKSVLKAIDDRDGQARHLRTI